MILNINQTICAPSTPPGFGAIGVIRMSGDKTLEILQKVFTPHYYSFHDYPKARHLYVGYFYDKEELIDEIQMVYYKAPGSYTGEDMAEFFHHGSPFIQKKILEILISNGVRLAKPGEFTFRAFLNQKMDLLKAESINDLVFAEHEASHKLAINQMRGFFTMRIQALRQKLIDLTALLELEIDFSEEDVEFADRNTLINIALEIISESQQLLDTFRMGNVLKNGIPVAIVGKPNVGKSTLLNRILGEDRAIVSDLPGTTRDYIEDVIYVRGLPLRFIDTAGIRGDAEHVEHLGIIKTYEKAREAEVILLMLEPSDVSVEYIQEQISLLQNHVKDFNEKKLIFVLNKIDLLDEFPSHWKTIMDRDIVFISAKRNENINLLLDKIVSYYEIQPQAIPDVVLTNLRHFEAFTCIIKQLEEAIELLRKNASQDLVSQACRIAIQELGQITGEITNEDILDSIFSRFCIGK
ncbi:MAG: tRNA uridine-5-carboxymethylaminomethyl(34) synthesis GTPase MnmE [Bacteroidales bacterium]|nr:tRNA uridine-5-carboxymethylaminomethyl(34) synthesis GTPase MnmE [Bacteroidales bacterium]